MKKFYSLLPILLAIFFWVLGSGCSIKFAEAPGLASAPAEPSAGAGLSQEAPPPAREPIYNLIVTPNKEKDPLILKPEETQLTFFIDPNNDPESVLGGEEGHNKKKIDNKGREMDLVVKLYCPFSAKNPNQARPIKYDPIKCTSDKANFTIVPSYDAVIKNNGLGKMIFTVNYQGNIIDKIPVQAFVGSPKLKIKEYKLSIKEEVQFKTKDNIAKKTPDVVIDLSYQVNQEQELHITITPLNPALLKAFQNKFKKNDASDPKISWDFTSRCPMALIEETNDQFYSDVTLLITQNERLKDFSDVSLRQNPEEQFDQFTEEDFGKTIDTLKKYGGIYYKAIFRPPNPREDEKGLGEAMDLIEKLDSNPSYPVRVAIVSPKIYVPWQILYKKLSGENRTIDTIFKEFWGFRYELGITDISQDDSPSHNSNSFNIPTSEEFVFAGYGGDGIINDNVHKYATYIENDIKDKIGKAGKEFKACYNRKDFFGQLKEKRQQVKIILAYGHATSGTDIDIAKQVRPNDKIKITIANKREWGNQTELELNKQCSTGGKISDLQFGEILTDGMTEIQLQEEIRNRLKQDAQITLIPEHATSGTLGDKDIEIYQLRSGDKIDISFGKEPEILKIPKLTKIIPSDGNISDHRFEEIQAIGKTVKQLQEEISKGLKQNDFQVAVTLFPYEPPGIKRDAIGPRFLFSRRDFLKPFDFYAFANMDDGGRLEAQPIVILNACETGTSGAAQPTKTIPFVQSLDYLGAGAVIATESPIWPRFAYIFGRSLLNELFNNDVDVSQAMHTVRCRYLKENNNPLGLLYTLHGNPAIRIKH